MHSERFPLSGYSVLSQNFFFNIFVTFSPIPDAAPYLIYEFIDQTLQPGPPVSLKCSCRGSPTPQISWLKNGYPIEKSNRSDPLL